MDNTLIYAAIISVVAATAISLSVHALPDSAEDRIEDFYATETAVHVSPHGLRKHMSAGDDGFVLVDLRSREEYEREHIVGAISIPAYTDPDTSAYGDVERIVNSFRALPEDKDVIVYCYSVPCMTGRKVGNILAEHDIHVKHLGVGWNEWRYHWESWNHEHEWNQTSVEDYVVSGSEPGEAPLLAPPMCGESDELGC